MLQQWFSCSSFFSKRLHDRLQDQTILLQSIPVTGIPGNQPDEKPIWRATTNIQPYKKPIWWAIDLSSDQPDEQFNLQTIDLTSDQPYNRPTWQVADLISKQFYERPTWWATNLTSNQPDRRNLLISRKMTVSKNYPSLMKNLLFEFRFLKQTFELPKKY